MSNGNNYFLKATEGLFLFLKRMTENTENLSFEDLIKQRTRDKREYYDDAHYKLLSDYVTLVKRNRGDYLGVMRTDKRNLWNSVLSKGFVTFPVIPRAIRSKVATAVSTDIQLELTSALKTPEKQAGAELASNAYKYAEEYYWTERLETMIALLGMTGRFSAVEITEDDENALCVGAREITENKWIKSQETLITCIDCGSTYEPEQLGLSASNEDEKRAPDAEAAEYDGATDAPEEFEESQSPAPAEDEMTAQSPDSPTQRPERPANPEYDLSAARCTNPECAGTRANLGIHTDADFEYREGLPTGDSETIRASKLKLTSIPSCLIRFDDIHTIGFDWQKLHWACYHPLVYKYEILSVHPELKDKISDKGWTDWSDSARWYFELTKESGNLGAPSTKQNSEMDELVEKEIWFFEKPMCNGWTQEGSDYELKRDDKVCFTIKVGEGIKEAMERETGKPFRGCCVEMVGDEIHDIKNASFLDRFILFGWQIDPASHVPMGEERLIPLQDAATRVLSMVYSGVQKMTNPKGVFDGRFFNKADLNDNQPGKWVGTKQDVADPEEKGGILSRVGYLTPPNPSSVVDMFINLVIQIAKEESGIYDETVGNANPRNETKGGRELALNQSLSLMTPTQKAKKEGKIQWARLILRKFQQMPDEFFSLVKGTFEEEWKAEDIKAFRALDIENELVIRAIEGTDKPRSDSDLANNIMIAAELGLLSDAPPFAPEIAQYILKRVLGIDFDINNLEADRRLAARRFDAMKEYADEAATSNDGDYSTLIESVIPDKLEDPLMQNQFPIQRLKKDLTFQLAQDPRTKPNQEDNHAVFVGYYVDQLKGIQGSREPNMIHALLLENAIDSHNAIISQVAMQQMKAEKLANDAMGGGENTEDAGQNDTPPTDVSQNGVAM